MSERMPMHHDRRPERESGVSKTDVEASGKESGRGLPEVDQEMMRLEVRYRHIRNFDPTVDYGMRAGVLNKEANDLRKSLKFGNPIAEAYYGGKDHDSQKAFRVGKDKKQAEAAARIEAIEREAAFMGAATRETIDLGDITKLDELLAREEAEASYVLQEAFNRKQLMERVIGAPPKDATADEMKVVRTRHLEASEAVERAQKKLQIVSDRRAYARLLAERATLRKHQLRGAA
ncbi:MAG: hypothetical protein RLZZ324_267 [Candidatus Parcubacteria bacterium]